MKNINLKFVLVSLAILLVVGTVVTLSIFLNRDKREISSESNNGETQKVTTDQPTEAVKPIITEQIQLTPIQTRVPTAILTQKVTPKPTVKVTALPTQSQKATSSPTVTPAQTKIVAPTVTSTPIPTPTPTPTQPTVATLSEEQLESEMEAYLLQLINSSRSANGKSTLSRNGSIDKVARGWAEYQASSGSSFHNSNLGGDLINAGVPYFGYGENIGYGVVTDSNNKQEFMNILKVIHNGMMAEQPPYDGHKRTILSQDVDYGYIGVGIEVEGKKFWLTTDYVM